MPVVLGSARQAGSGRLGSSRGACRLNASSSRLLPPISGRLLAKRLTASLDAIIAWETPSVSRRTLTLNPKSVAAHVRVRQRPGD